MFAHEHRRIFAGIVGAKEAGIVSMHVVDVFEVFHCQSGNVGPIACVFDCNVPRFCVNEGDKVFVALT